MFGVSINPNNTSSADQAGWSLSVVRSYCSFAFMLGIKLAHVVFGHNYAYQETKEAARGLRLEVAARKLTSWRLSSLASKLTEYLADLTSHVR